MRKVLLIAVVVLLTACRSDIVFSRFSPIPSGEWHMDSVLCFDFTVPDTTAAYDMTVYVRHTERYPYQNIWLFVGDSTCRDTVGCFLADDRGRWLGDRHHGFIESTVSIGQNRHFPNQGMGYVEIRHGMRDTLLRGVMDIGVEIIRKDQP